MAGAVVRDGQQVWSHAIETTTDTQFRIGSLTKTFVAVLVMRLRDEGRLGLDDPLEKHLADAPVRGLTIGQLLSHTAGLAGEAAGPWWERTPGTSGPSWPTSWATIRRSTLRRTASTTRTPALGCWAPWSRSSAASHGRRCCSARFSTRWR